MSDMNISEEEMAKIAAATKNETIDNDTKTHRLALMGTALAVGALPAWATISSHCWAVWMTK
jgi:hypothetical protein